MARYTHGPDLSDSDDSLFDDDGEYFEYKQKIKILKHQQEIQPLTEEQKRQQELNNLYAAIYSGNITNVLEFLDKGFDVNIDVKDKWTPLLLAASYGNCDLTKELLARGADPNSERGMCIIPTNPVLLVILMQYCGKILVVDATTALMMACNCPDYTSPFEKSFEVVKLLVEAGASVKANNRKRMTALMFASISGNIEAVKYLLPLSDKSALDNQRWSALTWAVSCNHVDIVKLLLNEGYNINFIDVRGNTAIDIAKEFNFEGILDLFPQDKEEIVLDILDDSKLDFEKNFEDLKKGQKPQFFLDVCKILISVKCDHLIPVFHEKNIRFDEFLGMCDADLKNVGVLLPYQRHRILTGLHRFHKHPYHPRSIHICVDNKIYSNVDVATQIFSAIKQIIAMEASLVYLRKMWQQGEMTKEEAETFKNNILGIQASIKSCKKVSRKLIGIFEKWDKIVQPADLITPSSRKRRLPWIKIAVSVGLMSAVVFFRMRK